MKRGGGGMNEGKVLGLTVSSKRGMNRSII